MGLQLNQQKESGRGVQAHTQTCTHLVARPAFQAVGVELVDVEDVDGALDAEVVQLAAHFEVQQIVLWTEGGQEELNVMCCSTRGCFLFFKPGETFRTHHGEVLQHLSVHSALIELVFVLREADVVQPAFGSQGKIQLVFP